jgi:hypothetical protein
VDRAREYLGVAYRWGGEVDGIELPADDTLKAARIELLPGQDGWQLIAVWDASRRKAPGGWGCEHWAEICEWALFHGADIDTWRYEIWLMDTPIARILRYARNETGYRHIDATDGEIAQQRVQVLPLDELPPEHLRVNADAEGYDCCPGTGPGPGHHFSEGET